MLLRVTAFLLEDMTFAQELESWCAERCSVFDIATQGDDEHSLEFCRSRSLARPFERERERELVPFSRPSHDAPGTRICTRSSANSSNDGSRASSTVLFAGVRVRCPRRARGPAGAGYSTTEFWQKLTKAVDDDAPFEGAGFMLECLQAATDYVQFANTMRLMRRNSGK